MTHVELTVVHDALRCNDRMRCVDFELEFVVVCVEELVGGVQWTSVGEEPVHYGCYVTGCGDVALVHDEGEHVVLFFHADVEAE